MHTTELNTHGMLALCWELPEAAGVIRPKEKPLKASSAAPDFPLPRHLPRRALPPEPTFLTTQLPSEPLAQWAGHRLPTGPSPVVGTTVLRNFGLPVFPWVRRGESWQGWQPPGERGGCELDSLPPAASMPDSTQTSLAPEGGMCQDILQGW